MKNTEITFTKLINNAKSWARVLGHTCIGTEHILLAYYAEYNQQLFNRLLIGIKKRMGEGSYYTGQLDATRSLTDKIIDMGAYHLGVNGLILSILFDKHCSGHIYLFY